MIKRYAAPLALAAGLIVAALASKFAAGSGWIDTETAARIVQVVIGLVLVGYGNVLPKKLSRPRATAEGERRTQTALRTTGWTMTLAGLVWAGLWAFAPEAVARPLGMLAVAAALATALGLGLWACRSTETPATR
jgi:peptidoglycan biosynthesis protein MviN/MurJ (putative lipid II flippase)